MITVAEAEQYIRLTLKQHKMSHIPVSWINKQSVLGLYWPCEKKIELSTRILCSFAVFRETLLHELAHALDHQERKSFLVNQKNSYHGKNWRKWCLTLGIPARRFIPV